jgi:hypothetical protein
MRWLCCSLRHNEILDPPPNPERVIIMIADTIVAAALLHVIDGFVQFLKAREANFKQEFAMIFRELPMVVGDAILGVFDR